MGHRLRVDFQSPCGRRGHRRWHLLVPDRVSGADWSCETPSGVAFFLHDYSLACIYCPVFSIMCLFSPEPGATGKPRLFFLLSALLYRIVWGKEGGGKND